MESVEASITYPVRVEPPLEVGALHDKFAPPACAVALKLNGTVGFVAKTKLMRV